MPPIPVHIDAPITPQKAAQLPPQAPATTPSHLAPTPTTTTPSTEQQEPPPPPSTSAYAPARPGAPAVPGPTPYIPRAQPQPTRTTPYTPVGQDVDAPPAPQPGAVPSAALNYNAPTGVNGASSTLPPPPKAGEAVTQNSQQQQQQLPPQINIPPPGVNYAATHSTATATTSTPATYNGAAGPTTLSFGAPVGASPTSSYQQNIYAQELSPAARASLEVQEEREGRDLRRGSSAIVQALGLGGGGDIAGRSAGSGGGVLGGAGGYNGGGSFGGGDGQDEGVWGAAKGWLGKAASKVAETEESVWRRINGKE